MAAKTNINSSLILSKDDLHITLMTGASGQFGKITDIGDRINHYVSNNHPTISALRTSADGTVLVKGSYTITTSWDDGKFTNEEIDEAIEEINNTDNPFVINSPVSFVKDTDNNQVVVTITNMEDTEYTDWASTLNNYVLQGDYLKLELNNNDCKYLCVTYLNNNFDQWKFRRNNILSGQSLEIPKDGQTVYVMFSDPVLKDGVRLDAFKAYKLSSGNITVENDSDQNIAVLKWDK